MLLSHFRNCQGMDSGRGRPLRLAHAHLIALIPALVFGKSVKAGRFPLELVLYIRI